MGNELKVQNSLVVAGPAIISGSLTTIGGLVASGSFNVTGSLNITNGGLDVQSATQTGTGTALNILNVGYSNSTIGIVTGSAFLVSTTANSSNRYTTTLRVGGGSDTSAHYLRYGEGNANGLRLDRSNSALGIFTGNGVYISNTDTDITPSARLHVKGSGTTSSTTALLVQNANASSSLQVRDDGSTLFNGSNGSTGTYVDTNGTLTVYRSIFGATYGLRVWNGAGWFGHNAIEALSYQYPIYGAQGANGSESASPLGSGAAVHGKGGVGVYGRGVTPSGDVGSIGVMATTLYVSSDGNTANYNRSASAHIIGLGTTSSTTALLVQNANTSASLVVLNNGFTGIGTSTPSASLHISGSSGSVLLEVDSNSTQNILYISGSGRIGMGISLPSASLHISGTAATPLFRVSNPASVDFTIQSDSTLTDYTGLYWGTDYKFLSKQSATLFVNIANNINFSNGFATKTTMNSSGQLGVGVTSAASILATTHVKGSGTTSSTTTFLVQNANATASLSVLDDGTTAVVSSNERPFTVSHTNGSSALGIVVGNGSALSAGFAALRLNDTTNVFTFGGSRIITALPLTIGGPTDTFYIRGGGGGSDVAAPSVALTDNTYNSGGYTVTSGTQTTVQIGGIGSPSNSIWKPASGTATYNLLVVAPNMSGSGTYSGTIRGIYYNPTVDSTTYGAHRAIETTAGDVVFSGGKVNITGSLSITGSAGSGSALYAYKSGSTVVDIQGSQGQLFSVIDALSGSLMSVNDVSGLPILEVFSDDRVVLGTYGAPALVITGSNAVFTGSVVIDGALLDTIRTGSLATGSTLIYTVNTSSYQAGFFDYYINSGSNFRAGNIMAVFGAGTYRFTDAATPDIGNTTNLQFSMSMAGASAQLFASASTAGWTVKTTFRTI